MSKRQQGSARPTDRPSDPWGCDRRSFIRSRRAGAAEER